VVFGPSKRNEKALVAAMIESLLWLLLYAFRKLKSSGLLLVVSQTGIEIKPTSDYDFQAETREVFNVCNERCVLIVLLLSLSKSGSND
jgi:hypothetical protein